MGRSPTGERREGDASDNIHDAYEYCGPEPALVI